MNNKITIETTYQEVKDFSNLGELFLQRSGNKMSPFLFSIKKTLRAIKGVIEEIEESEQEKLIQYAQKDEKGYLVIETNKPPKMKPEDQKAYNKEYKELMKKKISVEVFQYQDLDKIPEGVGMSNWDVLAPFVLPELDDQLFERLNSTPESK